MKLEDYIVVLQNHVPADLCASVIKELDSVDFETHVYSSYKDEMSYDNDLDVYYDSIPSKSVLMDYVWSAINAYVSSHATEWFNGWGGYSNIRFNKYKSGTEMRKHWDAIKEIFDGEVKGIPILSVIGLLNDNFTGGDLLISDNKVELSTGDVVIFPSSFMYPHEITKIKSNERYSFVSWVY